MKKVLIARTRVCNSDSLLFNEDKSLIRTVLVFLLSKLLFLFSIMCGNVQGKKRKKLIEKMG